MRVSSYKDIFLLLNHYAQGDALAWFSWGDVCRVKKPSICMVEIIRLFVKVKTLEAVLNVKSMKCIC